MIDRANTLRELSSRVFDVLVIGGGITGAGIARDAALRGLSVALVDKGDFASGTSSRSSRLIHGGVRYLEHGHLHLVFEASAERRRLLRLASHLVQPLAFTWPVYRGQRLPVWKLAAGLTLYDALAMFRNVARHRRLSASKVLEREPHLAADGLVGGLYYYDAATNDSRLTLANAIDAQRAGAVVANHVAVVGFRTNGKTSTERAVNLTDALTDSSFDLRARVIVNATGPWSDAVRQLESGGSASPSKVQGSKGAHIAVPRERLGNRGAVTILHPRDGRVMFALPSGAHAIIGTTDTFTDVSPDDVRATETDVAYLLEAANAFFPEAHLVRADVVSAWAGIRPLMPTTRSAVAASREHAITRTDAGTITITGGKLTTYRVMARQVVDVVQRSLGVKVRPSATDDTLLQDLWAGASRTDPIVPGLPPTRDDMRRGVEHELACTLGDLLIRRTHLAFETRDNGRATARRVAEIVGPLLQWDAARAQRELARYDEDVARIFAIDP